MVLPARLLPPLAAACLLVACQTTPVVAPRGEQTTDELAALHTQLGIGYMREGKNELAWKRLRRALDIDPNYSVAHNAMALLSEQLGEFDQAETHYRRAVDLNPSDSSAQNNFGRFLCRQGRTDEAEERFLMAVRNPLYDAPELAYTNAGLCMQSARHAEKAETYLRQALQIRANIAPALLGMAELSLDGGQELSARAYLQRYLEVGPNTPKSLWLGIRIERVLGDKNAESSYAMLLRSKYPDSTEAKLLRDSSQQ